MSKNEVYLVDDSADQRLIVRTIFSKYLPDYHIRFFQGAQELYQYLILQSSEDYKGRRPGLIILDLKMPTIDGYELLKLIRQTPDNDVTKWSIIPVIILTANYAHKDVLKCYAAGANSFLIKPVEVEELTFLFKTICHYWIDQNHIPSGSQTENNGMTSSPV